jgi:hypothetical protein
VQWRVGCPRVVRLAAGAIPLPAKHGAMRRRMDSCLDSNSRGRGLPFFDNEAGILSAGGLQFRVALSTVTPAGAIPFLKPLLWPGPLSPFLEHEGKSYVRLAGPCSCGALAPFLHWERCVSCLWSLRATDGVGSGAKIGLGI